MYFPVLYSRSLFILCIPYLQIPFNYSEIMVKSSCYCSFPVGTVVKNMPANAGDARDVAVILGS